MIHKKFLTVITSGERDLVEVNSGKLKTYALHSLQYYTIYFGEGNGNPLQYSCLENSMDWGAWWAIVHGVAKSRTRLSSFTIYFIIKSNQIKFCRPWHRHSHICLKTWTYFRPTLEEWMEKYAILLLFF